MIKLFRKTPQDLRILAGPFRGARMFLNPANSKRKILGLYEHVLNGWISRVAPRADFIFDVGSSTGFDLYGFAHLASSGKARPVTVVGFEPDVANLPELTTPLTWPEYSRCGIEIIEQFAGARVGEGITTLDAAFSARPALAGKTGLIKIDVEGEESEVLRGAATLLEAPQHHWLVEIHGRERIAAVASFFVEQNRPFLIREMKALPLIGAESREIETFWLTTLLD
jgi:hypothetical protein